MKFVLNPIEFIEIYDVLCNTKQNNSVLNNLHKKMKNHIISIVTKEYGDNEDKILISPSAQKWFDEQTIKINNLNLATSND